jgi:hypothetical protein
MSKTNFSKLIHNTKTFDELETLKQGFLKECEEHRNSIAVANLLGTIRNFGDAKVMFESIIPSLLGKKEGKTLIKNYTNIIKENKSLKTIYAYHEGLKDNTTADAKKNYITEALSIGNKIDNTEYLNGLESVIKIISESFKLIGDKEVLNIITFDDNVKAINESINYLATTTKTVKNLNQYINHINTASETLVEAKQNVDFNIDVTLDDILSSKSNNAQSVMESIFDDSVDKETTFKKTKEECLKMIKEQRNSSHDFEVSTKLDEMAQKLSKKSYNYDTYTKDMLFMSELQEVLN